MNRVILESPFAGNVELNIEYARLCIKDCLDQGDAPIASHLLFTQPGVLDDNNKEQRKLGIEAGHQWIRVADKVVVYADFGVSEGMKLGIKRAEDAQVDVEYRQLPYSRMELLRSKFHF